MFPVKEKIHNIKDYKLLPEGSPYQLIEGELIMTPAPSPFHQIISGNLFEKIRMFAKERNAGIVLYSPIDIYLDDENAYQPDIVFISKGKQEIIKDDGIHGAPDLIIEILSPSTAYYDIKKKYKVYERCGVKEYWIVDPLQKTIEVFFNKEGGFKLVGSAKGEGEINSEILKGNILSLKEVF